jgi:hypothetical protein
MTIVARKDFCDFDSIELLHQRLYLFMGEVWAEQLIIALHNLAKTGRRSYLDLLQTAADVAVQHHQTDFLE